MTCCWSQAAFTGVLWLEWQGSHKDDMNWDHGHGGGRWMGAEPESEGGQGESVAAD